MAGFLRLGDNEANITSRFGYALNLIIATPLVKTEYQYLIMRPGIRPEEILQLLREGRQVYLQVFCGRNEIAQLR